MNDDLTRRAIIAAHDAEYPGHGEDGLTYSKLSKRERAIVAQWRADVDRAEKAEAKTQRLQDLVDEFRKREESQDRIRELLTRERDNARAQIQYVCSEMAVTTGIRIDSPSEAVDTVRALKAMADDRYGQRDRAETAEAEVERLRTVIGMADNAGADILDERNNALAAIERAMGMWRRHTAGQAESERCVCLGCEMGRALDEGATDGTR